MKIVIVRIRDRKIVNAVSILTGVLETMGKDIDKWLMKMLLNVV